jgi:hypothetical protein
MLKVITIFMLIAISIRISAQSAEQSATIVWDSSSKRLLSPVGPNTYSGYGRMIQLIDGSLFAVYGNSDSGLTGTRSYDNGNTWGTPFSILPNTARQTMDNAEITQLRDSSLIVSTNLRPRGGKANADSPSHYQIGVVRSTDMGAHWSPLRILYTASTEAKDATWEPKVIQLPSGTVELYYSDEYPYQDNDDQNISLFTADEHAATWTRRPHIVSYRRGHRDGMPVPLLLRGDTVIAMAIEDNGCGRDFKISIIKDAVADGWSKVVSGSDPAREYALGNFAQPDDGNVYAGAPYLVKMPDGKTVLSFQCNKYMLTKKVPKNCQPTVMVGDENARNFSHPDTPFHLPDTYTGLWSSLCALRNGEVILLTTTGAFSSYGHDQVWMIKGKEVLK